MAAELTCPQCQRRQVLSEDDLVFFYPRFFCLSCGTKLAIPLKPEEYLRLSRLNDRDRRVPAVNGHRGPLKAVQAQGAKSQEAAG